MSGIPLLDLFSGFAQAKADAAKAQQARINADFARVQGIEVAEQSAEMLRKTLGNVAAIQSTRGIDSTSPTAMAIDAKTRQDSYRNQAIARLGTLQQVGSYQTQAQGFQTASNWGIPLALGKVASETASYFVGGGG